jgi:DNA-binding SARP family transcriptional activator
MQIRLLGDVEVRLGPIALEAFASPRLQSLLAFLIVHRDRPLARQRVAFIFWPDSSESQARTNLRHLLHMLRQALVEPDRYVSIDGQTVQWLPDASASIDVVDFEHAISAVDSGDEAESLRRALVHYGGDFLLGSYDDWVEPERQRLRRRYVWALDRLAAIAEETSDLDAGLRYAQELLRIDPCDEPTCRRLMRLHIAAGDRARALHAYHACESALAHDLGVTPSPDTVTLYEGLVADGTGSTASSVPAAISTPPLIGRDEEWEQLVRYRRQASEPSTRFVLVSGEAGIGKSRLAEDFRRWCARQNMATASSRGYLAEGSLPYAPIIELLRGDAIRPHLRRLDTRTRRQLSRILPELNDDVELASTEWHGHDAPRQRLFEALARAFTETGQVLTLVIDDLQWCDVETLQFLHFLVRLEPATGLMLVGTVRDGEFGPGHPLRSLVAALRSLDAIVEIPLRRLDREAATTLAEDLLGVDSDPTFRNRVAELSEGNPLFLVELARSGPGSWSSTLPPRVQSVIEARLDMLPEDAAHLVSAAAVIGRAFTIEEVGRIGAHGDVLVGLDELWRRGVVRERGSDAYDFCHDLIRDVAYQALGPGRRRQLHLDVANTLSEMHRHELDSVAAEIAVHFDRAGSVDEALAFYERAVGVARRAFADYEVVTLARRGLELLSRERSGPERDQRELQFLIPLGVALHAGAGQGPGAELVYDRSTALRAEMGLGPDLSTLRVRANLAITRRDFVEAQRLGRVLMNLADETGNQVLRTEGHYVLGVSAFWLGEFESSRVELTQAIALYEPARSDLHLELFGQDPYAVCLVRLAWTSWYLGRLDDVWPLADQALQHACALGHSFTPTYVRIHTALLALDAGDVDRMQEAIASLPDEATTNAWVSIVQTAIRGWMEVRLGDLARGTRQLEQAVDLCRTMTQWTHEPMSLMLLGQAYGLGGDPGLGADILGQAHAIAAREMPVHAAETSRLHGELLQAAGGDRRDVETHLRRAVTISLSRGSVVLELRARTSLLRWLRASSDPETAAESRTIDDLVQRLQRRVNGASSAGAVMIEQLRASASVR